MLLSVEDGGVGAGEDLDGSASHPWLHLRDQRRHHLLPHASGLHLSVARQSAAVSQGRHQPCLHTLVS